MSNGSRKVIDVDKLFENKLKEVSVGSLENAIAKVVSDMSRRLQMHDWRSKYTIFSGADFHIKIELSYNPEQ